MIDEAASALLWRSISSGDMGAEAMEASRQRDEELLEDRIDRIASQLKGIDAPVKTDDERLLEKALRDG